MGKIVAIGCSMLTAAWVKERRSLCSSVVRKKTFHKALEQQRESQCLCPVPTKRSAARSSSRTASTRSRCMLDWVRMDPMLVKGTVLIARDAPDWNGATLFADWFYVVRVE